MCWHYPICFTLQTQVIPVPCSASTWSCYLMLLYTSFVLLFFWKNQLNPQSSFQNTQPSHSKKAGESTAEGVYTGGNLLESNLNLLALVYNYPSKLVGKKQSKNWFQWIYFLEAIHVCSDYMSGGPFHLSVYFHYVMDWEEEIIISFSFPPFCVYLTYYNHVPLQLPDVITCLW